MPKEENGWMTYTAEELKALWKQQKADGKTRLTQKEWTAKFMIDQSKKLNKAKPKSKPSKPAKKTKASSTTKASNPVKKAKPSTTKKAAAKKDATPQSKAKKKKPVPKSDAGPPAQSDLKLTKKEEGFCQYYAQTGHLTNSAISAGYAKDSAHVTGSRMLRKAKIKSRLAELGMDIRKRYQAELDNVVNELSIMAFSSMSDLVVIDGNGIPYIDISRASEEQLRAIETYKVTDMPPIEVLGAYGEMEREVMKTEVKLYPKIAALKELVRMANLAAVDDINVHVNGNISHDIPDIAKKMAFILNKADKLKEKEGKK